MTKRLIWTRDGADWPNRVASRFVKVDGLDWHVQVMGSGPPVLLLHGTGASTHSWRDVAPILARQFTVVIPDLPGHGFTTGARADHFTRIGMARAVGALLGALGMEPERAIGHSAGAVILVEMAVAGLLSAKAIVSFNGAFFPVSGVAGHFFSPMARAAAALPFLPRLFASIADRAAVERLLSDTGSRTDARMLTLYHRLFSCDDHVSGTLRMMAGWDLASVEERLRHLDAMLYLVIGTKDRTVSPETASRAGALVAHHAIIAMRGLGHLAHEEDPVLAADIIIGPERYAVVKDAMVERERGRP